MAASRLPGIRVSENLPKGLESRKLDDDLERVLTVAATVGAHSSDDYLISFTSLLIGLLTAGDPMSGWFLKYCKTHDVLVDDIYGGRDTNSDDARKLLSQIDSGRIDSEKKLWSISADRMMQAASDMAKKSAMSDRKLGVPPLGVRHLLAGLAFNRPPGHDDQISKWNLQPALLKVELATKLVETFHEEDWSFLQKSNPAAQNAVNSTAASEGASGPDDISETVDAKQGRENAAIQELAKLDGDIVAAGAKDHLDVEREAQAFARVAASQGTKPPLAIGVFGEWGSGKTFFMEKMRAHVDLLQEVARQAEASAYHSEIVQIRFNAWHYMEKNLWASLVDHIFRELDNWLRPKQEQDEIDALYEKLSTARLLKLEALEGLIEARRRRKVAVERVEQARKALTAEETRIATVSADDFWQAVKSTLSKEQAAQMAKTQIQEAADALGFNCAAQSGKDLLEALSAAGDQIQRGQLLWRSLTRKLGNPLWFWTAIVLLISAPFLLPMLMDKLAIFLHWEGFSSVQKVVLALCSIAATITGWVGLALKHGSTALNTLSVFQGQLDEALRKRQDQNPDPVLQAEQSLAYRQDEVEISEMDLERADRYVQQVRGEFDDTARGRLNRFIRDKISNGDYAKHLGIIATIRRDFDQLAEMMADVDRTGGADSEYQAERRAYASKIEALGLEEKVKEGLLLEEEAESIRAELARPETDLRFFQRIILYIDDLDRCPPLKVVQVLQACHLLLCFPLFVVVVAVDARWVSRSLIDRYKGLLDGEPSEKRQCDQGKEEGYTGLDDSASPRDYLEKIFQIPYWVRRMRTTASISYVTDLVSTVLVAQEDISKDAIDTKKTTSHVSVSHEEKISENSSIDKETQDEAVEGKHNEEQGAETEKKPFDVDPNPETLVLSQETQELVARFAPFAGQSPRTLKRFVNVYRLLRTSLDEQAFAALVAEQGNSAVHYAVLVQLAIVTGAPSLADRYFSFLDHRISTSGGKPDTVTDLIEGLKKDELIGNSVQWPSIEGSLKIAAKEHDSSEMIDKLGKYANLVKRYSFSARP